MTVYNIGLSHDIQRTISVVKRGLIFLMLSICLNLVQAQGVTFTLANEQVTNGGTSWEADVMIESTAEFKLGSGQLYFNYHPTAFEQNVSANNKLTITHPSGSLLATTVGSPPFQFDYYTQFIESDNTVSRFSYSWQHAFSEACLGGNNVTATPAILFHIQLDYAAGSENSLSGVCFEYSALFDDQTFTACGPGDCNNVDCVNFQGTQIINDIFNCSLILPFELRQFEARLESSEYVLLEWVTEQESNTSHFDIERSYQDSNKWAYLGKVSARGQSSEPVQYDFRDQSFDENLMYYRLKMWDTDQAYAYSEIRTVKIQPISAIQIFPNPTSSQLNVEFEKSESSEAIFSIWDTNNRIIWSHAYQVNKGENSFSFNLRTIPKGEYFFRVEDQNDLYIEKLIIQ